MVGYHIYGSDVAVVREKEDYYITELRAQAESAGIQTRYYIAADTSSPEFQKAASDFQLTNIMLALEDDDPRFMEALEKSGLSAQQYRSALEHAAADAKKRVDTLSAGITLPTNEFLAFVAHRAQKAEVALRTTSDNKPKKKRFSAFRILGLLLAVAVIVVAASEIGDFSPDNVPPVAVSQSNLTEACMPKNGSMIFNTTKNTDRIAPLEIKTSGSHAHYIKMESVASPSKFVTFFVHPGEAVEVKMPIGKYYLKYASGYTWYGLKDLFGPDTIYTKSDDIFHFYEEDGYVNGYTVTLYNVSNGNLDTETINASEF